jgi:hypothetical protein
MIEPSIESAAISLQEANLATNSEPSIKLSVWDGLVWTAVVLSPFQDTALQNTPLKLLAASPSIVPLSALFLLVSARRLLKKPFVVGRSTFIMAVYASMVCAVNLVWMNHGEAVIYWKPLLTYTFLTAFMLFTVFGMDYRASRGLRIAIYLGFCFTIGGIVCGQLLGPNAIPLLQVTPSLSGRPHGFSTEASTLSVQIVASGMLTAHFLARNWQKWGVAIVTCLLLVFSDSKGGLISLLLCGVVLGIAKSRSSVLSKIVVAIVMIPFIYFGSMFILSAFGTIVDTNQTSTIATRLSMPVYAVIAVAHNPFGVGFTGFLPSIPRYLPNAMSFVQSLFPFPLWFGEVKGYLYQSQANADCKTFFFDFLAFFGIPFAVTFFWFMSTLLRRLYRHQCYWLFVGVLFSVIALMTYYSALNAWTVPLLFGISLHELGRVEIPTRVH